MRHPSIFDVESVVKIADQIATELRRPDGSRRWVPARPIAPTWNRWRATWLVFTGRADALTWPGQ